jgi:hypothetical protein
LRRLRLAAIQLFEAEMDGRHDIAPFRNLSAHTRARNRPTALGLG